MRLSSQHLERRSNSGVPTRNTTCLRFWSLLQSSSPCFSKPLLCNYPSIFLSNNSSRMVTDRKCEYRCSSRQYDGSRPLGLETGGAEYREFRIGGKQCLPRRQSLPQYQNTAADLKLCLDVIGTAFSYDNGTKRGRPRLTDRTLTCSRKDEDHA